MRNPEKGKYVIFLGYDPYMTSHEKIYQIVGVNKESKDDNQWEVCVKTDDGIVDCWYKRMFAEVVKII